MRIARGLTGRSTGTFVLRSGEVLVGPFDGKHPARAARKAILDLAPGTEVEVVQLWDLSSALTWARGGDKVTS